MAQYGCRPLDRMEGCCDFQSVSIRPGNRPWKEQFQRTARTLPPSEKETPVLITRYALLSVIALPLGIVLTLQGELGTEEPVASDHATARVLEVSFADEVAPILEENCIRCHGGPQDDGAVVLEAGLNLTSYETIMVGSEFGSVVEPGNPDDSMMLTLVRDGDMPEEGDPLSPEQVEVIRTWITEGAKDN